MTENFIMYIIVWIIWLLAVFAFVIGIEKMVKIVLGNYILGSICLAASQSIDLLINFVAKTPELKMAGMSYESVWVMLSNSKTAIVLIIYVVLLVVIYKNSSIKITLPMDPVAQKWILVFLVPLTVLSMILTLQIAVMWVNAINAVQLQALANTLTTNVTIYNFLIMTPVWILLHGLATILISSELKVGIKTGI